jgi:hypothetical protein
VVQARDVGLHEKSLCVLPNKQGADRFKLHVHVTQAGIERRGGTKGLNWEEV